MVVTPLLIIFLIIFQLYPDGQFMVATPLLIIFQLYPGRQFMVVTPLLIIFHFYGGYLTFNNISVISYFGQFMVVTSYILVVSLWWLPYF